MCLLSNVIHVRIIFTVKLCSPARVSLAEILVLAGTAALGRMVPPDSTGISVRLKRVGEHSLPVNIHVVCALAQAGHQASWMSVVCVAGIMDHSWVDHVNWLIGLCIHHDTGCC